MIKNGEIQVNKLIEIDELKLELKKTQKLYLEALNRIDKAIEILKLCNSKCSKEVIGILGGINEHRK